LRGTIEAPRDHAFDLAQQTNTIDRGKEIMDEARQIAGQIDAIQQIIMNERDSELRRSAIVSRRD